MRSPISRIDFNASTMFARGTRNSDCTSSPLLGVNSSLKCARRSFHGPGTPPWVVVLVAAWSGSMCSSTVWRIAPNRSSGGVGWSMRDFSQAIFMVSPSQFVNRLTLYALEVIASKFSRAASHGRSL